MEGYYKSFLIESVYYRPGVMSCYCLIFSLFVDPPSSAFLSEVFILNKSGAPILFMIVVDFLRPAGREFLGLT